MKALLGNRYAPLTYSFGFLDIAFQQLVDETIAWKKSHFREIETLAIESSLSEALAHLDPLITPPRKSLLLATKSNWVASFDNSAMGGDPDSFVGYMAERLRCRGLTVTCVPPHSSNAKRARAPSSAVGFTLYAPEKREWLNVERSVSVVSDYGDWEFKSTGSVQAFEKHERYQAPVAKDRFTAEMLDEYCRALNVRLFDEDFYGPSGMLVNIVDPLPPDFVAIPLAEARSRLGIKP
jgi:hypothetical protein